MSEPRPVDQEKLNQFLGKFVNDLGASMHGPTVVVGERLGLYKALAQQGGLTSAELAQKTGTVERFVREWLAAQAASGYVSYDGAGGRFFLSPEQEFALTNEAGPVYIPGVFYVIQAAFVDEPKILSAFRTGKGVGWHEHSEMLFEGTSKFFRPNYTGNLVPAWLPALDGVVAKLEKGAKVADVGCGFGSSTILMAQAFPKSSFVGYDYHQVSINGARALAEEERAVERVKFEVATAQAYPGKGFDLVTFFDCLHDMSDPLGAARHVRETLKKDGTWMVVEPFANDRLADNLTPVGRAFYSVSTMICTPASLSEKGGAGLGAQASDAQLEKVARDAGFTRFRRAASTPFNRVLEIRP